MTWFSVFGAVVIVVGVVACRRRLRVRFGWFREQFPLFQVK
jgi:hypothetical protein